NPYCSLASLESPQAQPCLAGSAALRGGSVRHTDWEQLEEPVRLAIEARTGRVRAARTVSAGLNSQLATVLDTDAGTVFVKGLRVDHPGVVRQGTRGDDQSL